MQMAMNYFFYFNEMRGEEPENNDDYTNLLI